MNLENFRKQAKLLVRWHRERNYSVGGRIRQLARYQQLTDPETLALPFPLHEAQEIIALEQGCATWAELKDRLTQQAAPASSPSTTTTTLTRAIPVLLVSDVERAATFYRDILGFTIDFLHGHPPFYGSITRDGATLHLRFVHQPSLTPEFREHEQVLAAFIPVTNIKGLFAEYEARGDVPFVHRLRKEPWDQSAFIVRDPDDNWICFAG